MPANSVSLPATIKSKQVIHRQRQLFAVDFHRIPDYLRCDGKKLKIMAYGLMMLKTRKRLRLLSGLLLRRDCLAFERKKRPIGVENRVPLWIISVRRTREYAPLDVSENAALAPACLFLLSL
jgi:hypothetical protein